MPKTKPKASSPEAKTDKVKRLPVKRMPSALRRGDHLVVTVGRDGYVDKTNEIKHIERGKGCRNYHINSGCYHQHVALLVAVPEDEVNAFAEFSDDLENVSRLVETALAEVERAERKPKSRSKRKVRN